MIDRKILTYIAFALIGLGGLTILGMLLTALYCMSTTVGVFATAALVMIVGCIILNILEDDKGHY